MYRFQFERATNNLIGKASPSHENSAPRWENGVLHILQWTLFFHCLEIRLHRDHLNIQKPSSAAISTGGNQKIRLSGFSNIGELPNFFEGATFRAMKLKDRLKTSSLLLDGAAGTWLQGQTITPEQWGDVEGCNEWLNLSAPASR